VLQTIELPQNYAQQHPQLMENAAVWTGHRQSPAARQNLLLFSVRSSRRHSDTNALYNDDPDDFRVRDVSGEARV